jgi:CRISPR type IV-associated protein Csf3
MKTYKITFNLTSPLAMQQTIMFDGLLAYAYFQEHAPDKEKNIGRLSFDEIYDFSGMPLVLNERGYHMASWLLYEKEMAAEQIHTALKKWEEGLDHMADFGKAKRAVMIDRGEFKTTQIPIRVVNVPQVWFYFQSDNVGEVQRLIEKHIVGIGKKISRGYGFFSRFDIEEAENVFETQILRPIPVDESEVEYTVEGRSYEYRAWKMPYWLPENFTFCRVS